MIRMHTATTTATATKTSLEKRIRAYSISLNSSNVGKIFWELNSKGLYQSSGKENESCCLAFTSTRKRQFRHFDVVVVERWQRMYLLLFCRSRCRRRRRCLSSLRIWPIQYGSLRGVGRNSGQLPVQRLHLSKTLLPLNIF